MDVLTLAGYEVRVVQLAQEKDGASGKVLRIQIAPISDKPLTHPTAGSLLFDRAFADKLIANFKAYPGEVPGDYDHGVENANGDPARAIASGWIRGLKVEAIDGGGEALFAYMEPTTRALGLVEAKEYRFASPTIHFDWTNPETGKAQGPTLLSVALTNRPFIRGMAEVAAVDGETLTFRSPGVPSKRAPTNPSKEPVVDTISLADHNVKVGVLNAQIQALSDQVKAADTAKAELSSKLATAEAEKVSLSAKVAEFETAKRKADAAAAVEVLLSAGKALPAEKESLIKLHESSPELFAQITKDRPVLVKFSGKGVATPESAQGGDKAAMLHAAAEKIASEQKVSYRDAISMAIHFNPDLRDGLI